MSEEQAETAGSERDPALTIKPNRLAGSDACLNCGTETAHVSYKTPEERLEAARQAAYLWNIGKVIHNGMCD